MKLTIEVYVCGGGGVAVMKLTQSYSSGNNSNGMSSMSTYILHRHQYWYYLETSLIHFD